MIGAPSAGLARRKEVFSKRFIMNGGMNMAGVAMPIREGTTCHHPQQSIHPSIHPSIETELSKGWYHLGCTGEATTPHLSHSRLGSLFALP